MRSTNPNILCVYKGMKNVHSTLYVINYTDTFSKVMCVRENTLIPVSVLLLFLWSRLDSHRKVCRAAGLWCQAVHNFPRQSKEYAYLAILRQVSSCYSFVLWALYVIPHPPSGTVGWQASLDGHQPLAESLLACYWVRTIERGSVRPIHPRNARSKRTVFIIIEVSPAAMGQLWTAALVKFNWLKTTCHLTGFRKDILVLHWTAFMNFFFL